MPKDRAPTRIQKKNRAAILEAALNVFSAHGFRGATVDQIATEAGLSKPNLLYYFPSKEAIHTALLSGLLETWLAPLHDLDEKGDPLKEILSYIHRKLQMSRELPRESRLFANELVQGAPRIHDANTICQPSHDGEIVRNPDHGSPGLAAQCLRLVDDLRLDRHIRSACGR